MNETYKRFLNDNSLLGSYDSLNSGEQSGVAQSFSNLGGVSGYTSPTGDSGYSLDGTMDWLGENSKGINAGIGLASLGMNAYSSFFGQGKKTYDKNMTLLNQQIESNKRILDNNAAVKTAWANTEKSKGLAAAGVGTQNG